MIRYSFIILILISVGFVIYPLISKNEQDLKSYEKVKQEVETVVKNDMIIVDYPKPNDLVTSPLEIRGRARGGWYFEGDFPITLYYGVKTDFVDTYATAQGEWMTNDFVEFSATVEFPEHSASEGTISLRKSNPSDLRELDDSIIIPVRFK